VTDPIDALIDEVLVDAYGEDEQLWSFRQVFEDRGRFPFRGQVVGADVEVLAVDYDGDERRGLLGVCRRTAATARGSLYRRSIARPATAAWRRASV